MVVTAPCLPKRKEIAVDLPSSVPSASGVLQLGLIRSHLSTNRPLRV